MVNKDKLVELIAVAQESDALNRMEHALTFHLKLRERLKRRHKGDD